MAQVINLARPRGRGPLDIEQQQSIENALCMALHYVRGASCNAEQLRLATAKAGTALRLLSAAGGQRVDVGRA